MLKNKDNLLLPIENLLIILFGIYFFLFFLFGANSSTVIFSEIVFFVILGVQLIIILTLKRTNLSMGIYILLPFTFILIVGVLYAPNQNYALIILQTFLILLLFISLVINTITTYTLLEKLIAALGIACTGISLYAISLYGMGSIFESILSGNRIGYKISQPNTLGYFSAIGFLIYSYYVLYSKGRMSTLIYLFFCLVNLFIVFATISRRAILICILGFILLFIYKKTKVFGVRWIVFFVAASGFLAMLQLPQLEFFSERINSLTSLVFNNQSEVNSSDMIRANLINYGFNLFYDSFWWGYGTGAFRFLAISTIGYEVASHNNFIEILVNHGILGFFFYYLPIFYVGLKVWKQIKKVYDPLGMLLLVLLICDIIISGMTAYTYYSKISVFLYSLNIVYLSLNKSNKKTRN